MGKIPDRLALVVGSETMGVSAEMVAAADQSVFLPMFGFMESLNVAIAASLFMQRLFDLCPESRGDLEPEARETLRKKWISILNRGPEEDQ